jgi:hypothetical protein
MKLAISQSIKKQAARNRASLNVSEKEYIEKAFVHYDQLLTLNSQLQEELAVWEGASATDFKTWSHKHKA